MALTRRDFFALSSDGEHTLAGVVFLPEGEIKGFFQVVHGMTEYVGRYERFMRDIAEEGYVCFGHDHLGHGMTARDDTELGFIAKKDGWDILCRDVKSFSDAVFAEYKRENQPYILMGHSMGSFVVRLAAEKYVKPDRLIIMGTGGANPAAGAGLALIGAVKALKGERHISPLVYAIAFGDNNKRFVSENDPNSWLSNDREIRDKYRGDKYCTFKFTVSAMGDLIRVLKESNRGGWYKNIDKKMPILLVSGENDPIGNYGKGVREVCDKLAKHRANAKCILYKDARHEILNDFCYEDVKNDILDFCE